MKFWLGFILIIHTCIAVSQGFSKTYVDNRPVMHYASMLVKDSSIFTIGLTAQNNSPFFIKPLFSKLDFNGNLIEYTALNDTDRYDYGFFENTYAEENDSVLKLFGYVDGGTKPCLITMDYKGNVIKQKIFTDTNSIFFRGDIIVKDDSGNYYLGSAHQKQGDVGNGYIIKIDRNDSILWQRKYGFTPWMEYINSLYLLPNNNILVGSFRRNLDDTNEEAHTWIYELNGAGSIVRQWYDPNDSTYGAESLKQTKDKGFIYGSLKKQEQSVNDVYCYGTIVKLDSSLKKKWSFTGNIFSNVTNIYDVEELPNGNVIGCGSTYYYNPGLSRVDGWIVMLSPTGSVIWDKTFTASPNNIGTYSYLNDIDILPDGRIIACGYANIYQLPSQKQQGWILKLDTNGCIIDNCLVGIDDEIALQTAEINVYPNPFTTQISISLHQIPTNQATFTITNTLGQTVYTQNETNLGHIYTKTLHLNHLPNGIYFIQITTADEKLVRQIVKQ